MTDGQTELPFCRCIYRIQLLAKLNAAEVREDDGSPTTHDNFDVTYFVGLLIPTPLMSSLIIAVSSAKLTT